MSGLLGLVVFLLVAGTLQFTFVRTAIGAIRHTGRNRVDWWAANNRCRLEAVEERPSMFGTSAGDRRQCFEVTFVDEWGRRFRAVLRVGSFVLGAMDGRVEVLECRPRP